MGGATASGQGEIVIDIKLSGECTDHGPFEFRNTCPQCYNKALTRLDTARHWVNRWRRDEKHEDSADWYMQKVAEALAGKLPVPDTAMDRHGQGETVTDEGNRPLASVADDDLVAECVRRGWRVVYPGSEADRYLFDPPDPDVKTAREQAVLDALEKLFDAVEAMRKAKS